MAKNSSVYHLVTAQQLVCYDKISQVVTVGSLFCVQIYLKEMDRSKRSEIISDTAWSKSDFFLDVLF